jgi:hypothetical protein
MNPASKITAIPMTKSTFRTVSLHVRAMENAVNGRDAQLPEEQPGKPARPVPLRRGARHQFERVFTRCGKHPS